MNLKCYLGLLVFCTFMLNALDASAYCRMRTGDGAQVGNTGCSEEGEPLEWRETSLTYAVDADGSQWMSFPQAEAAVDAGFFAWAEVTCEDGPVELSFQPLEACSCNVAEYDEDGDNVNAVAFLDPWVDPSSNEALPRLALAVTIVWHNDRTGEIIDADMLINDTRGLCPPEEPSCGGFDTQSIVTHEAGHFLGIGHSEFADATMYYMSPPEGDISMRTLGTDDVNAVCAIYGPGGEGGGGCSLAGRQSAERSWFWALLGLASFTVWGRRRGRRGARS